MTGEGLQRRDFEQAERPTKEQLEKFFDEDGVVMPALKAAPSAGGASGTKRAKGKKQAAKTKLKRRPKGRPGSSRAKGAKPKRSAVGNPKKLKASRGTKKRGAMKRA
jgi:hypothetical protein